MVDADRVGRTVDRVLRRRLPHLQQLTGLPVVFGGTVTGQTLRIDHLHGTVSEALRGLQVSSGRGLGGTAIARGTPCRVNDYAAAAAITHDFDRHVVHHERITSVFALPVRVQGAVGGILYGAVRTTEPIGDVALQRASAFAGSVERELAAAAARPEPPDRTQLAIDQLLDIARATPDTALRGRLLRVVDDLAAQRPAWPPALDEPGAGRAVRLAPREVEALALVAVGMRNREVADAMSVGVETVKSYLRSAMRRLDVSTRTAAVHAAREAGLL